MADRPIIGPQPDLPASLQEAIAVIREQTKDPVWSARLQIHEATKDWWFGTNPTRGLYPGGNLGLLFGIPILYDNEIPPGAWRLIGHDGKELHRGGYPQRRYSLQARRIEGERVEVRFAYGNDLEIHQEVPVDGHTTGVISVGPNRELETLRAQVREIAWRAWRSDPMNMGPDRVYARGLFEAIGDLLPQCPAIEQVGRGGRRCTLPALHPPVGLSTETRHNWDRGPYAPVLCSCGARITRAAEPVACACGQIHPALRREV